MGGRKGRDLKELKKVWHGWSVVTKRERGIMGQNLS